MHVLFITYTIILISLPIQSITLISNVTLVQIINKVMVMNIKLKQVNFI